MSSAASCSMLVTSRSQGKVLALRPQTSSSMAPVSSRCVQHSRQQQQQRRRHGVMVHATNTSGDKSPGATSTTAPSSSSSSMNEVDEAEARIEAIEAASRKARSKTAARRQIPIRNMTPKQEDTSSSRAEWKKGKLFPEGWEQMSLGEKVVELYLGQRGMLFWATELSWKGAIALGVAWVLFRVGGAVGLYQLQGDLLTPPPL